MQLAFGGYRILDMDSGGNNADQQIVLSIER